MLECFNPSAPSGAFTLVFGLVMLVAGAVGYRWLIGSKYAAKLKELEAKAAAHDDKRRG